MEGQREAEDVQNREQETAGGKYPVGGKQKRGEADSIVALYDGRAVRYLDSVTDGKTRTPVYGFEVAFRVSPRLPV